jgi:hypothetical protein
MEHANYSVLDDKLALLSLRTAQEVDRRLHGGPVDTTVLVEFGKRLAEASGIDDAPETALLSSDPTATEVFSQAIQESSPQSVKDLETLTTLIKQIIHPLIGDNEDLSTDDLRAVKSFCLAFHKSLAAQRLPMIFERETPFNEATGLYR